MKPVSIYCWPDGSEVTCRVDDGWGQGVFQICFPSGTEELWIDWRSRSVFTDRQQEYPKEILRYILGFLLDLGLPRTTGTGLVRSEDIQIAAYPFFIHDEVWESRCEISFARPESDRVSWEAENVLRGRWVFPAEGEVELYRILGEELPFWWEPGKLTAWLAERAS